MEEQRKTNKCPNPKCGKDLVVWDRYLVCLSCDYSQKERRVKTQIPIELNDWLIKGGR